MAGPPLAPPLAADQEWLAGEVATKKPNPNPNPNPNPSPNPNPNPISSTRLEKWATVKPRWARRVGSSKYR